MQKSIRPLLSFRPFPRRREPRFRAGHQLTVSLILKIKRAISFGLRS